jgi:hypothetical protein
MMKCLNDFFYFFQSYFFQWLSVLIARGYHIHCGFDADLAGDAAASRMLALHPTVRRLRPAAKDWNDALTCRG